MFSFLVEIKIRSRGPPDLRAVAHQWAMIHRLRTTDLSFIDEQQAIKHTGVFQECFSFFLNALKNLCVVIVFSEVMLLSGTTSLKKAAESSCTC